MALKFNFIDSEKGVSKEDLEREIDGFPTNTFVGDGQLNIWYSLANGGTIKMKLQEARGYVEIRQPIDIKLLGSNEVHLRFRYKEDQYILFYN